MDRLLTQILNLLLRKAVKRGLGAAMRRGKAPGNTASGGPDQSAQAQALAKRAQQMARLTRRMGR